jgi:hypothetical protein
MVGYLEYLKNVFANTRKGDLIVRDVSDIDVVYIRMDKAVSFGALIKCDP